MGITASIYEISVVGVHLVLSAIGLWLVVIDAREHRLPNRIVVPTGIGVALLVGLDALATQSTQRLLTSLLGMLILGGLYLLLGMLSRGGMGGGDIKLAGVLGLVLGWHGWNAVIVGTALAFVLAALYALALMAMRRATKTTRIAFGPWMVLGAVLGVLAG